MQDKHTIKCSFCDHTVSTVFSAVICPDCEKSIIIHNCPGCGLPIGSEEKVVHEHSRIWHETCSSLFDLTENDDDQKDFNNISKMEIKKQRKILTGKSTYLFYDEEITNAQKPKYDIHKEEDEVYSPEDEEEDIEAENMHNLHGEDNDDYGYLSPVVKETNDDQAVPNFFSTNYRQIMNRLQSLGFIRNNVYDGKVFQNSISGNEFITFLITCKQCHTSEQACQIGQNFVDLGMLIPIDPDEEEDDEKEKEVKDVEFIGETELYYVNETVSGDEQEGEAVQEVIQPIKEHNKILRMTGYLTTFNNDGKSQRLWYELTAGILRSYASPPNTRLKNEDGDNSCIEALDTQEFTVVAVQKVNEESTRTFKLTGAVREISFQADTEDECEEWICVLRNRN